MIILPTLLSTTIVATLWIRYGFQIAWPSACILTLFLAIHVLDRKSQEGRSRTWVRFLFLMVAAAMLFSIFRDLLQDVPTGSLSGPTTITMIMFLARQLGSDQSEKSKAGPPSTASEAAE